MGLFSSLTSKKKAVPAFDAQTEEAALRCSICTGEQTAGFRNKNTGHFREIMLIRSDLPADKRVNVIGQVPSNALLLLDLIGRLIQANVLLAAHHLVEAQQGFRPFKKPQPDVSCFHDLIRITGLVFFECALRHS